MQFSDGERLILVMLAEIYKKLEIERANINPDLVLSSIFGNKTWGLRWEYGSLFSEGENPPVVEETADILTMYRAITSAFEKLSPEDKKRVETEAAPFGAYVRFKGFDANNDEHFGVASYLVKDLGRFSELKDTYLNSHSLAELRQYQKMLPRFKKIEHPYSGLTADQLIEILK